jgi:hypothetical protein
LSTAAATGVLVRYEDHEARTPSEHEWRGVIDIYRAGQGLHGYDAMLPVDLADQIIRMIKAAGVPVRHEWNDIAVEE